MATRSITLMRSAGVGIIALSLTVYVKIASGLSLSKISGTGDLLPAYSTSSSIIGCGRWDSQFGYPFGTYQSLRPSSDWLYSIPANLITCTSGNPFLGLNLVWLMSFPLTFVLLFVLLNHFRVWFPLALTIALVGTLIPFHWVRLSHLYLSVTFPTVLILFLCVYLVQLRTIKSRGDLGCIANWPKWLVSLIGFTLAISGVYYAVFGLIMMAVAFLVYASENKWSKETLMRSWVFVPVLLGLILSQLVSWQANRLSPGDPQANERAVSHTILYSGNLTRLLLPSPSSGVDLPDWLQTKISNIEGLAQQFNLPVPFESGSYQNIPTVLLFLFTLLLTTFTRFSKFEGLTLEKQQSRLLELKMLWLVLISSIAFFVPWGLNLIFAEFVSPQIRAWGRLEPIIVITLLVLSSIYVNRFFQSFERYRQIQSTVLITLLLLLFVDVTPMMSEAVRSNIGTIQSDFQSAKEFGNQISLRDPNDCGVLQVPYMSWPESGPLFNLPQDGHLLMGLAIPDKNWTFGAFESSPTDVFSKDIGNDLSNAELVLLRENNFCGVQIDLRGFESQVQYSPIVDQLTRDLDSNPLISSNGYWMYWTIP